MPSGRRRPPVAPAESTIGSTGSTQGESAVAAPATNPNRIRRAMRSSLAARDYAEVTAAGLKRPYSPRFRPVGGGSGGLGGDRALGPGHDLGVAAEPLADPVVEADRHLVLAQQRSARIYGGGLPHSPPPPGGPHPPPAPPPPPPAGRPPPAPPPGPRRHHHPHPAP